MMIISVQQPCPNCVTWYFNPDTGVCSFCGYKYPPGPPAPPTEE